MDSRESLVRTNTRLIQSCQSTRGERGIARPDWRAEGACAANSHVRIISEIPELRDAGKLQARSDDYPALVVTLLVTLNGVGTDRTSLQLPAKVSSEVESCTSTFYPLLGTSLRCDRSLREATFRSENVLTNLYRSPVPFGTGSLLLRATDFARWRNAKKYTRHACRSGWPRTVI